MDELMKDRIRMVMDNQHQSQKEFAAFLGLSEASLSSIFTGRTKPTLNIVEAIKNKIPSISTDWLVFGVGEMLGQESTIEEVEKGTENLSSPIAATEGVLAFTDPSSGKEVIEPTLFQSPNVPQETVREVVKYIEKPQRVITEIRIFYDDQTWETFVPKK